jgi:hypothetical protein
MKSVQRWRAVIVLFLRGYCFKHHRWPTRICIQTRDALLAYDTQDWRRFPYNSWMGVLHGFCPECEVERVERRTARAIFRDGQNKAYESLLK